MEAARLALEYLKAFLTPAPLAAGIVLFLLVKYREAIGNTFRLIADRAEFQQKIDGATQVGYLGLQFTRVGVLYDKLYGDKVITLERYRRWATFATHFKVAYPQLVELWKNAAEGSGRAVGERSRAEALALTKAVMEFEATAYYFLAAIAGPEATAAKAATEPPEPEGHGGSER